ncbi:MAG: choice-of-anchor D domain-containing protein [Myxococcaceae bacterium]
MNHTLKAVAAALLCALVFAPGCTCEENTRKSSPKIELPLPAGGELTLLDFGTVQVDVEHQREVRIRNGGTASLSITAAATAAPFGVKNTLPLVIGIGQEDVLLVTYSPVVADQRQTGRLTLSSDDRARPEVVVDLAGQGIQAVAVASPSPIDFKDVYLKESRKITVTLSNTGSNDLDIKSAKLVPEQTTVTGDLSPLVTKLAAGASVSADLTYSPTEMSYLTGTLEISPDPLQGQKLTLPIVGRGVISLPSMCFQHDGQAEICTDPANPAPNLQVRFPSLCDSRLYPPDGGPSSCTAASNMRSGKLYLRNAGNIQVGYTLQYTPYIYGTKDRCDAGYPAEPDFTFSNAPPLADGGQPFTYQEGKVALPANPNDPKPWETSQVTVSYRARSRCREEASDLARVVWTRQSLDGGLEPASHTPTTILLTADGTSKLPHAVNSDWSCGAVGQPQQVPCHYIFYGVNNSGDAPLQVTAVELWEETPTAADSGIQDAGGPNGGYFAPCTANPYGSCAQFAWEASDGGDPNQYAPHALAAAVTPGPPTQKVLGTLVFGPDGASKCVDYPGPPPYRTCSCLDGGTGCATPNRLYRIYAVIKTDDPYGADVFTRLQGVAAPPP